MLTDVSLLDELAMPTTYLDQFFIIDPFNPPPVGTSLTVQKYNLLDNNDDNDFDRFNGDSVNGSDIVSSWPGDTVTVNVPGVGNVTYTGITFYLADGTQVFTPNDGQVLMDGTFVSATAVNTQGPLTIAELGPPCFAAGTMIDTAHGPKATEALAIGDLVPTRDHGMQPIRWVGKRTVSGRGEFAPIRFARGAIGNDQPLNVSPQHRMLITGWRAEIHFGEQEILVAAKHLVNGDTIHVQKVDEVEYVHILFDEHEIIGCHGVQSESLNPGVVANHANRAAQCEILTLFPELHASLSGKCHLARPAAKGYEARLLSPLYA